VKVKEQEAVFQNGRSQRNAWPLHNIDYRPLYLDPNDGMLYTTARRDAGKAVYEP
jgi:hypothetical protein